MKTIIGAWENYAPIIVYGLKTGWKNGEPIWYNRYNRIVFRLKTSYKKSRNKRVRQLHRLPYPMLLQDQSMNEAAQKRSHHCYDETRLS
ncbi:hypothetical protein [Prevotella aurantiaca]|uniref:hypothetical protein n=1 Tax=Prevotella aurantiaca TaxID=596085 RepID=UPI001CB0DB7D|nr:hypothetical protein [Prevotella aurantiaca]MBF1386441.1 hypothetical protein [Prevotella aurantiaca]